MVASSMKCCCVFLVLILASVSAYIVDPGPVVIATKGEIWPKPKEQIIEQSFSVVRPSVLRFETSNNTCAILDDAFKRYSKLISYTINHRFMRKRQRTAPSVVARRYDTWRTNVDFQGYLDVVRVNLKSPCEHLPYLGMDEAYKLTVRENVATLESNSVWGILRGLESFSQMIVVADDDTSLRINSTKIVDSPRYSHRGLLLDTSRHYINVYTIIQILDGMAYNKMNVFHWHIVDDHSFPYQSFKFPELSHKGAFHPTAMIYTQEDVQRVIEQARIRGIRVMAEFDTPGHTRSWGVSHPELLTACEGKYAGKLGPMDPTKETTYEFLHELLKEVTNVFPDKYFHIGGDEVGFECWNSSAHVMNFMRNENITTFEHLEEKFIQRVVEMVDGLNSSSMVWQEVFVNGVKLPKGTVVHVWTGNQQALLNSITGKGLPALLSACWYLDHLLTGGDWQKFYQCEPNDFPGTVEMKSLVMGGEACMWGEVVDNSNIIQRIFPRVSATAEKLWSQESVNNLKDAAKRLEEHTCRMKTRGIAAQPPNGPGFCL